MASKKVLVVFGATGVQGGSVVKAILGDSRLKQSWTVRGVTRDVSKPSAKALEAQGAETVAVSDNLPIGMGLDTQYILGGSERCVHFENRLKGCLCCLRSHQLLGIPQR